MCIKSQKVQKKFVVSDNYEDPQSILDDLKLLLEMLKAAGLFPIFKKMSDYELEPPSKQNEFYSFCIRTMAHLMTVFTLYNVFQQRSVQLFNTNRGTDNINYYIEILISIITFTCAMFLCSKHSNNFLKLLTELLKVDFDIRERYGTRVRNNCKSNMWLILGSVSSQLFIIAIKLRINSITATSQYVVVVIYAIQNWMCMMIVILLVSCLRVIAMRFEFVNMVLGNYMYTMDGIKRRGPGITPFEADVAFTFRLHNRLLKIFKLLNDSSSLMVACFMGYGFYSITTNTYNIFVEFTTYREVSVSLLLNCFTWLASNLVLLTVITQNCSRTTKKANNTSQILARVYGKSKDYQNIIDKFLTKSIRQEVQFTAYGFFVVDNSTLFKIFSAVTTYLVILIQFKQLEDTKLDEANESTI